MADIRFRESIADTATVYTDEAKRRAVDSQQRSLMEWTRPTSSGQPDVVPIRLQGPWGREFLQALHEWARLLEWPALPVPPHEDFPCSYLEMLVNFVVWSGRLPPTPVSSPRERRFIPSLEAAARLQPQTLSDFTGTFQEALLFLAAQDSTLLPARRMQGLPHLRALGLPQLQHGLDQRPRFPPAPEWVRLLSDSCQIRSASLLLRHCQ